MKLAALLISSAVCAGAFGQPPKPNEPESKPRVSVEKSGDQTRIVVEQDIAVRIDVAAKPSKTCAATMSLEYEQRNTVARASGTIENPQCAASHGEYTLVVTVRDANGELKTLEFKERWRRVDAKDVELMRDYGIGDNVDLVRVRARGLSCTCDDEAAQ